ncbi:cupin domain-containing protein [Lysinibacillus halotolerans]|uniref:Cupin domain-containing protein n=1 Tax=Lysinibacillus halotolerans TaxID=1368476 RepID=A0A3M8H479_9BACI|nr:cupin domain-containing protein [Lysinibacillus halotolerans]
MFEKNSFETKIDFIDFSIIPPNSTIGYHAHSNNEEIYFILEGEGEMIVNGTEFLVKKGDIVINSQYSSHGLRNIGSKDIKLLVFQVSN